MKLKIVFCLSVLLIMFACTEDGVYSCDPSVDSWVKENKSEIQRMNRSQWLDLDENLSMAAYRAFTPKQRIQFWEERFDEIKQLPWSDKELKHISGVEDFMNNHQNFFEDKQLNDDQLDELHLFFYDWSKYALEELHWDKKVIDGILASGRKMINVKGDMLIQTEMKTRSAVVLTYSAEPTCNCNPDYFFACAPNSDSECNIKKSCKLVTRSCGFLFLLDCNGLCDPL